MEHWKNLTLDNLTEVVDGILYTEEWKPVVDYEGLYEVSSFGRVKSVSKLVNHPSGGKALKKVKILKQNLKPCGYLYVQLYKEQNSLSKRVHRLVLSAFELNIFNKPSVNHKDNNRRNNKKSNLEWVTAQENSDHASENGRYKPCLHMLGRLGALNPKSKPVAMCNDRSEVIKIFDGQSEASRQTGIPQANIWKACVGERLSAGGFKWKYA